MQFDRILAQAAFALGFILLAMGCRTDVRASRPMPDRQPNVIVIVSDDAGYADFGFHGSEQVPTPNLDALAAKGVQFTQGYVSASVCSPSRAGLLTGRYQQRFGHEGNLSDPQLGLPTSESTLADQMKQQGYTTVALGKWHLGYNDEYHPLRRGFDEFYGMLAGSRSYFPILDRRPGRQAILHDHEQIEESELSYLTDDLGVFAAEYIEREHDQPFFMYLAFNAPHAPMHATENDLARFSDIEAQNRRKYVAMVYAMDRAVGGVVEALHTTGQFDNTLIVFVNDNGGPYGNASDNGPLRGIKGSKWEGGVRVPFFMHWPAGLEGARTYDPPVISLDILPTTLAAAGGQPDAALELDGVNLLPYLHGEIESQPHEVLFWRRYVAAAVRRGPWKLIRVTGSDPILIHLENDLGETTNLARQHPEIVSAMLGELEAWEAELATPLWREGQRWENNQIRKHQMDVVGREMEGQFP